MSKKKINFFEKHVEKIVLGIAVTASLFLLVTKVLISSKYVEYQNRKYGVSSIDRVILEKAKDLEVEINRDPEVEKKYASRIDEFLSIYNSSLKGVNTDLKFPLPSHREISVAAGGSFSVPETGTVENVKAEHIRSVAYIPQDEVDLEEKYEDVETEPNDLDLVTVEAKYDVASLYESFKETFLGSSVPVELRDPCLAEPVFAAVELQRQEQLPNGRWSDWKMIPRSKSDDFRKLFKIVEDVDKMPAGGIKVKLLQYKEPYLIRNLLQPRPYAIASPDERWFPPSLHEDFEKMQDERRALERRKALLERKREMESQREDRGTSRRPRRRRTSDTGDYGGGDYGGGAGDFGGSDYGSNRNSRNRRDRRDSSGEDRVKEMIERKEEELGEEEDIYEKYQDMLITEEKEIEDQEDNLTFWAYDDTVKPDKTYRYRIRLGFFNPLAGSNRFAEEYKEYSDDVILWSDFSEITEPVKIPSTLYFFPIGYQESVETVTVQVSKYELGYWYSEDFRVKKGEMIGYPEEYVPEYEKEKENEESGSSIDPFAGAPGEQQLFTAVPEEIDYSTGAMLVDVESVNDWYGSRNLNPRAYYEMLYSKDGDAIKGMPIKSTYWDDELVAKYNEIRKLEKLEREEFRSFEVEPTGGGKSGYGGDYGGDYDDYGPGGGETLY